MADRAGVIEPFQSFLPPGALFNTEDTVPGLKLKSELLHSEMLNRHTAIITREEIKPLYLKRPVIMMDNGCKEEYYIAGFILKILK